MSYIIPDTFFLDLQFKHDEYYNATLKSVTIEEEPYDEKANIANRCCQSLNPGHFPHPLPTCSSTADDEDRTHDRYAGGRLVHRGQVLIPTIGPDGESTIAWVECQHRTVLHGGFGQDRSGESLYISHRNDRVSTEGEIAIADSSICCKHTEALAAGQRAAASPEGISGIAKVYWDRMKERDDTFGPDDWFAYVQRRDPTKLLHSECGYLLSTLAL